MDRGHYPEVCVHLSLLEQIYKLYLHLDISHISQDSISFLQNEDE